MVVEAEDVTHFVIVVKTDYLLLITKVSIFEVGNNLLLWVTVNVHVFEDSGRVIDGLLVIDDVYLRFGMSTVAGAIITF